MLKPLVGAALGLFIGIAFGTFVALLIHLTQSGPDDWSDYPTVVGRHGERQVVSERYSSLSDKMLFGILLGGGFGAVVGAVTGATATVVQAVGENR